MSDPVQHPHHTRETAPPDGSDVEVTTVEARQGETSGRMRIVLFTSLFTVALIFAVIWPAIARL